MSEPSLATIDGPPADALSRCLVLLLKGALYRDETPAEQGFRMERTTGFEPATLTLAR
jgi:hypothetical protein